MKQTKDKVSNKPANIGYLLAWLAAVLAAVSAVAGLLVPGPHPSRVRRRLMRVLVVYASHYGSTKGIAERIGYTIHEQGLDVELRSADVDSVELADKRYDAYVIGSAVHMGHWLRPAADFVRDNADVLASRPTWLFSSGPVGEKYVHEPQPDPEEIDEFRRLLDVCDHVVFAGASDPSTADQGKAGWLERQITKHFLPVGDFRDWTAIETWAVEIARNLRPVAVAA